jgi:hypothetical protein
VYFFYPALAEGDIEHWMYFFAVHCVDSKLLKGILAPHPHGWGYMMTPPKGAKKKYAEK